MRAFRKGHFAKKKNYIILSRVRRSFASMNSYNEGVEIGFGLILREAKTAKIRTTWENNWG